MTEEYSKLGICSIQPNIMLIFFYIIKEKNACLGVHHILQCSDVSRKFLS